ncbi:MAG: hypothetical protein EBR30_25490 [Cytophagia bacterium]|nr:hypothetical protein [Cytophagia bacterium]
MRAHLVDPQVNRFARVAGCFRGFPGEFEKRVVHVVLERFDYGERRMAFLPAIDNPRGELDVVDLAVEELDVSL